MKLPMNDRRGYELAKRSIDVLVSAVLLVLTLPLLAAVSITIQLTMGRPVLFRQLRPGRDGRPFTLVKFRTLATAAPGDDRVADDERLTKVGRILRSTSLDELPTLWNVLLGQMSLVGPRPLLMQYLDRYTPEQAERMLVPPGITGWAQVNGRNAISWPDKFELDRWYVHNRGLLLDLRILGRTLLKVFRREGISAAGSATMPEFMGQTAPEPAPPDASGYGER
jgi:lipopolysaccharide/colanic/teichoic acid biosynthesis glycosyltransferase